MALARFPVRFAEQSIGSCQGISRRLAIPMLNATTVCERHDTYRALAKDWGGGAPCDFAKMS